MSVRDFENKRWQEPQSLEFRHHAARSLVREHSVLDIGCGDGTLMALLSEDGVTAEGVDLSDAAVTASEARGFSATRVSLGDESLPFANASFPCVIALDVLEHVYDPGVILKEMVRVSSHAVILGVPNFSSLPARLQTLVGAVPENNRPHKGHVYWFTWKVLSDLVKEHTLTIEEVRVNAPLERTPLAPLTQCLARIWPDVFALSFVVRCTVSSGS